MKVAAIGRVDEFEALEPGTVLVAQVVGRPTLCLKAFYLDADGRRVDRLIGLAPGLEAYRGRPGLLEPQALTAPAVMALGEAELSPVVTAWPRMRFVDSADPETAGQMVICGGRTYLTFLQGAGADTGLDYVDVESGRILAPPDKLFRTVLPEWSVVRRDGGRVEEIHRFAG